MGNVDGFLYSNVSPMRHFDGALQASDSHERRVVFVMNRDVGLGVS